MSMANPTHMLAFTLKTISLYMRPVTKRAKCWSLRLKTAIGKGIIMVPEDQTNKLFIINRIYDSLDG